MTRSSWAEGPLRTRNGLSDLGAHELAVAIVVARYADQRLLGPTTPRTRHRPVRRLLLDQRTTAGVLVPQVEARIVALRADGRAGLSLAWLPRSCTSRPHRSGHGVATQAESFPSVTPRRRGAERGPRAGRSDRGRSGRPLGSPGGSTRRRAAPGGDGSAQRPKPPGA
jgi:hypothetical protein